MKLSIRIIPFFLALTCLHGEESNSCGIPNEPSVPVGPPTCKYNPNSGEDDGDDGEGAGGSSLGPAPHSAATPATGSIELPKSVIGINHGGALMNSTDLHVPGALSGVPLEFTRYYNSRDSNGLGDLMGHGRTWTHSFSWRLSVIGTSRWVFFPSGRRLEFTPSGASTYLGQASTVYVPPLGNGERLHNVGEFWHLVMPGGTAHSFERVVRADSSVVFHPRESRDTRGNKLTYLSNTSARITQASDAAGNAINLTYSQVTLNRKAAVALHTIPAAPQVGWNEVIIPAGESFRWIQAVSAPSASFEISEIEFYKSNGSGGHTLLSGVVYGTDPALDDGPNTFGKAFDGSVSTRFTFCRPSNGIAGIDLGASGAAAVTKIRYHVMSAFSSNLGRFVGMRFEGMREQPQSLTVLSAVSATTGGSAEFQYGTYFDASIGQTHSVLENVIYRSASAAVTDEAALTWVTAQEGSSPCIGRSREPRSESATPDIAFEYYPGHIAVNGQPKRILTGDPGNSQLIQESSPKHTAKYTAPDGGIHTVVNTNGSAYLPSSTTDAGGKTTTYTWTSSRFLATKTTPAGTTTYTRNALGQPLTVTHPGGLVETNTYDTLGRILTRTQSASGHPARVTTYTRDINGRVTRVTHPDNSYEDYTYATLGLLTSVREKNGSFTIHSYDTTVGSPTAGLRLSTTRGLPTAGSAPTLGETTTYTWHLPGNASGSPARLLASVTDPRGRTTTYQYDHAGRTTKTTYPDGSFRQFVLDEFGNKTSEFDGVSLEEWTYDSFRRVLNHTDAALGVTTYDYGLNGSSCNCYGSGGPTLVTSPAGRKTRRTYDLMGRLLTETNGFLATEAATTTNTYNALGRLIQVADPDNVITTFTHDAMGRILTTTQDPTGLNLTTSHTYSAYGDSLTTTAPGGRTSTMAYDKLSRPVTITDPLGTITTVTYDLGGRRTVVTQAFGTAVARSTNFAYNLFDRLITTTYPDSTTTSQTYHPGGALATSTDQLGRTTSQDSVLTTWTDSFSQSWTSFAHTTTDPASLTTTAYGPPMAFTGGTRRIVSPGGRVTESYMDELGRTTLIRSGLVTTASGLTADVSDTVMTHDPDGMVLTSTTDPSGLNLTTTNTYDALARTKTTKDPLSRTTIYTYDKRGNLLTTKLPDNREHTATFDALSRRKTTTDPKNQTITYTYWYETGHTLTLKDARNFTTTWTYNLRGQLLTKTYPNGDDHAYTYDTLGRIATHTTPLNHVCTYTYDLRDRQLLANWSTTTPDTAKTYWANGLLKSIDNSVSKSDYAYNNRNLLTSETQTLASRPARVVSYDYDADGLRSDLVYPSARAVELTWTARAQLETVGADGPPPLATYTYDKAGRTTALAHENGITEQKSYDAASQLLANTHKKNGTPVSGHGYTLDPTGRRTDETFADGTTPARSYGYDFADQVTAATYGSSQSDTYAYDAMGNRTLASIASQGGSTVNYGTANNANQYTSITGLTPITHDANGNLLLQNNVSYAWDSENRLLSVTPNTPVLGEKSLVHTYDGQHRRVTSTVREWTAGGWTATETLNFIYDGWNVIEEYELNALNTALLRNRTWGQDLGGSASLQAAGGVGGLIMVEEINGTTTAYHFHYDGNGNVTEVTDLSGNSAATYRYDAFGNTLVSTGSYASQNRYRFSTKPLNSEVTSAPLYYYTYRYYDPVTGRWPSRDPIEERGGMNLYGFLNNDGINYVDLFGQSRIRKQYVEYKVKMTYVCEIPEEALAEGEVTATDCASCPAPQTTSGSHAEVWSKLIAAQEQENAGNSKAEDSAYKKAKEFCKKSGGRCIEAVIQNNEFAEPRIYFDY